MKIFVLSSLSGKFSPFINKQKNKLPTKKGVAH